MEGRFSPLMHWTITVPDNFTMKCWPLFKVIVHNMTQLIDGKENFKLAIYCSQTIQYVKDSTEEIWDFTLSDGRVTIQKIRNESRQCVENYSQKPAHFNCLSNLISQVAHCPCCPEMQWKVRILVYKQYIFWIFLKSSFSVYPIYNSLWSQRISHANTVYIFASSPSISIGE